MIQILPSHISNLIAAGEVVQRPSSAVKELLENSIDAGATLISLIILDAGRTLIQIIDNGCGMSKDEAILCFERHATSKIATAEDLEAILTYGFRGEALASIAAVAEVNLKTRKEESEIGHEVNFNESKLISQEPISCSKGTNISIRNLFYNVPARRKFLKSDNTEFRQIHNEFNRIAIANPQIEFRLSHQHKDISILKPVSNSKKRIMDIVGSNLIKKLVEIETDTPLVRISGFVGDPEDSKKSQPNQYLYVNGRFFKSPTLNRAVTKAYQHLIPEGNHPSYFIFIQIDPKDIDINIHPSKIEVKFEDEFILFEIINAAVREGLGKNAFGSSIDFDLEGAPEIPITRKNVYAPPPKIDYDPLFNPFIPESIDSPKPYSPSTFTAYPSKVDETVDGYGEIFEEKIASSKNIIQVKGKYLITSVKSGLLLINIRRATERILYEKFLKSLDNYTPINQAILFPQSIDLDPNSYSILMEDPEKIKVLGFDISPLGGYTIAVNGLPEGYSTDKFAIEKEIDSLVSILSENRSSLMKAEVRSNIASAMAISGASGRTNITNEIQAQALIDNLFACMDPERTPRGKECMTIITLEELEKRL